MITTFQLPKGRLRINQNDMHRSETQILQK